MRYPISGWERNRPDIEPRMRHFESIHIRDSAASETA